MRPAFQVGIALSDGLVFAAVIACSPFILARVQTSTDPKFHRIHKDDAQAAVIAMVGAPDSTGHCGNDLWWGEGNYVGRNDGRCVMEARYSYFLDEWIVGYSADERVVSMTHLFSE